MVDSDWNYKKLIKLWAQIWFYSVSCGAIYYLTVGSFPGIRSIAKIFLPIVSNTFWYFSSYFVLYLLIPYINIVLTQLNKRKTQALLLILLILFSIIPTFTFSYWLTGINNIMIFVALYVSGNFIKRFKPCINKGQAFFSSITIFVLILVSEILLKLYTDFDEYYFVWDTYKFPVVMLGIMLFLWLKDIKVRNFRARIVSIISVHSSAIYLLHIGWLSPIIFLSVFNNSTVFGGISIIPHIVIYAVSIIIGSIIIDIVCKYLYSKIGNMCVKLTNNLASASE